MKRVVAKFVPWLLLPEQKEHRAAVADDLIQTATNEPGFLKKATEVSLSFLQRVLYLLQYISIFHSVWMDTFWTYLIFFLSIFQILITFQEFTFFCLQLTISTLI